MKTSKQMTTDEKLDLLIEQFGKMDQKMDSIEGRVEEMRVDTNDIKGKVFETSLRISTLERKTKLLSVDIAAVKKQTDTIPGMKKNIKDIKREVTGLTSLVGNLYTNAVSIKEHKDLAARVTALEQS